MEKAKNIIYQDRYCCNCNRWFKAMNGRFEICGCGNTDAIGLGEQHGHIDWEMQKLLITVTGRDVVEYSFDDYNDIIPILYKLPILDGAKLRNRIIKTEEEKKYLDGEKTWFLLSHKIHCKKSPLYISLWKKGHYDICRELIYEATPREQKVSDEVCDIVVDASKILSGEKLFLAVDNIMEGVQPDLAIFLAAHNIENHDYIELKNKYHLTDEVLQRDISGYYAFGDNLIADIDEYYGLIDWFRNDLGDDENLKGDEPLLVKLHYMRTAKALYIESGVYAIRKLIVSFRHKFDAREAIRVQMLDGKVIRYATLQEIECNPLIVEKIPREGVTDIPLVILENNVIKTVVFKNDTIVMEGECGDIQKELTNRFLDEEQKGFDNVHDKRIQNQKVFP